MLGENNNHEAKGIRIIPARRISEGISLTSISGLDGKTASAACHTSHDSKARLPMIESDDVVAITQNVFSTMIQMETNPVATDSCIEPETGMIGCIQIVGEWCGTVILQTSVALASAASSRMFAMNEDEVTDADRQDSLAELTNMIGGNIKSIVPSPSNLSLPTVTNGKDFEFLNYGSKPVSATTFIGDAHLFRIIILEKMS